MTTSNYSFTNFANTGKTVSNGGTVAKKATEKQISYYMDLCVQRKVAPVNYLTKTYEEMGLLIEELRKFYPASPKQIEMIVEKISSLNALGVSAPIKEPNYATLTGGREGTASALIEHLLDIEKQLGDIMPPTDNQLQFLVSMYLCPDVPFESFGIQRRVELGDGLWRKLTPDEFAESLKANMKKREASGFIDAHRGAFHTWKQTRVRPEQQKYIRELESRMANLTPTSAIEWSVDEEGNLVQVTRKVDKSKHYAPTGYVPLDEMELAMFSVEEASKYIDILKSEQGRKDLYKYGESADESETFESIRTGKTQAQSKDNEFKELQDLMFRLEAVAGYADEELHNAVSSLLLEEGVASEYVAEQKLKIKEFMFSLMEDDYISFEGMTELCTNSKVAQRILMGM